MQDKLDTLMNRIWDRKIPFFIVFFFVVLSTYAFLVVIDFVPEEPGTSASVETGETESVEAESAEEDEEMEEVVAVSVDPYPTKIIFDDLDGKTIAVLNPTSNAVADLDAALLKGAVRHPDSADFSEPGNVFILAHSSYLPNVLNKNFQAFNGIQNLDWGDTIRVQSSDMEYTYFVEEVYKASASDVVVPYTPGKAQLTLATCNSFGTKDDRFIVEAKLVDQKAL